MKIINKLIKSFKEPNYALWNIVYRGDLSKMPDKKFLEIEFKHRMGVELNLDNPRTFNEKLQWLKLYDRNPEYVKLVDKLEVRKYIEEVIGKEYLIPLIGKWDNFEEIDFSKFPDKFVLKTTHDSGGVVICKDKTIFNIENAKEIINSSMNRNYFYAGREWPYKNVRPRIICEELIEGENNNLPNDYKFHCFNGVPDNVMVCTERETSNPKYYFFDNNWNLLRYNKMGEKAASNFSLPKPSKLNKMFEIAAKLSQNLPFVRVDLYFENNQVYFGELTFYPKSGFDSEFIRETDLLFGSKIVTKRNYN